MANVGDTNLVFVLKDEKDDCLRNGGGLMTKRRAEVRISGKADIRVKC